VQELELLTKVHGPNACSSSNIESMLRIYDRRKMKSSIRQIAHVVLQI
jgi:hypothetical protein